MAKLPPELKVLPLQYTDVGIWGQGHAWLCARRDRRSQCRGL